MLETWLSMMAWWTLVYFLYCEPLILRHKTV